MRIEKEKIDTATINIAKELENPINAKAIFKNINEINNGLRLSNLATNQPDIGKPINELMGRASKTFPNCASFKSYIIFMVGIRDAHVAKQKPDSRKKALNEIRCL